MQATKDNPFVSKQLWFPRGGNPSMMSIGEETYNSSIILGLKKLVSGTKILLEDLSSHNPYKNKKSNNKSFI